MNLVEIRLLERPSTKREWLRHTRIAGVIHSLPEAWVLPTSKCSIALTLCSRGKCQRANTGFILAIAVFEAIENVGRVLLREFVEARRYVKRNLGLRPILPIAFD